MAAVGSTALTNDQGKYIAATLVERSVQIHKLPQFTNPVSLDQGNGKTANFVKFNRTDVPVDRLTEGTTPTETAFTISTQSVTVDQWGMFISLTDVGLITSKHPVLNEALNLVADAIARVHDYTIAEVLNAGTNTQFWDGTRADRAAVTSSDTFKAAVLNKARADMNDLGAVPREGEQYVIVCGPQIEADILSEQGASGAVIQSSYAYAMANSGKADKLEKGLVGMWLGFKIIRSNFVPKFTRLAATGIVLGTGTSGGSLAVGTYPVKVTRKSLSRGFEEDIALETSQAVAGSGSDDTITVALPSTVGYVYNVYAGVAAASGDSSLYLQSENAVAGATVTITAISTSGVNPPKTPAASITVHPLYVFAANAVDAVTLKGSEMTGTITPQGATDSDPLAQRRKVGTKYMAKSGIRNTFATKRIELVSNF